jgi:nucleoside transporter
MNPAATKTATGPMSGSMRVRLSIMMFLEFFIWGAWYVTLGTWLSQSALHFDARQVGLAAGTTAVGAMVAPFLVGLVADRYFATQRVLALLHALGAIALWVASLQSSFVPLYWVILLYCLCYMPTLALTNSLAFRQMQDPKTEFSPIRVSGTLGWIIAGLLIGFAGVEATQRPIQLAAAVSAIMAIYCLTLPATPPLLTVASVGKRGIFPREVLQLVSRRSMAIFALASMAICIPLQFYYAYTNLYLNKIGVANAAAKMTGGQASEFFCMLLIPWFFRRLGVKYMLIAGMIAWVARYLLFAYGAPGDKIWMLWGGILLHGICYDFFFVTGQIFIDREAPAAIRAAAQGFITFLTYGVGMFVGSWLSSSVAEHYSQTLADGSVSYQWRSIWIFCAAASAIVLVLFAITFKEDAPRPREEVSLDKAA